MEKYVRRSMFQVLGKSTAASFAFFLCFSKVDMGKKWKVFNPYYETNQSIRPFKRF